MSLRAVLWFPILKDLESSEMEGKFFTVAEAAATFFSFSRYTWVSIVICPATPGLPGEVQLHW